VKIVKKVLATLDDVYSVARIEIGGRTHLISASEGKDACLLFSPPTWGATRIWDGPSGTMTVVPYPHREKAILAIQRFFPPLKGEKAGIVYSEATGKVSDPWSVRWLVDLPFVHRIGVLRDGSESFLIAGTICGGKAFLEDWSQPGAVYACPVPKDPSSRWPLEPILEGIRQNHGLRITRRAGRPIVLIGAQEGLYEITRSSSKAWAVERILECAVSDADVIDIDDDGEDELITIEPFHGDWVRIYKQTQKKWQSIYESGIHFGHVAWGGRLRGQPGMLISSRRGGGELTWFSWDPKGGTSLSSMQKIDIDRGGQAAQVDVIQGRDMDLILATNSGLKEVALYEIT
jgi:hypothetical protein